MLTPAGIDFQKVMCAIGGREHANRDRAKGMLTRAGYSLFVQRASRGSREHGTRRGS
jgi:hypothetical protein